MDLETKLAILAGAAKYDVSCASSGSSRGREPRAGGSGRGGGPSGTRLWGAAAPAGVCHSWTSDGRCVSLLKVLLSNACRYDCAYCVNRRSNDVARAAFTVDELVGLVKAFYLRNYVEGLFLSSGVFADSDLVMERLVAVARRLREEEGFGGYIHLKLIPGAGSRWEAEACRWADRVSVNIELPTARSLELLAPQKSGREILGSMRFVSELGAEAAESRRRPGAAGSPAPAGQSTQLIVGASPEDDRRILGLASALYRNYSLRRVYYSAFIPPADPPDRPGAVLRDRRLPSLAAPPLLREHRLYQADWLLRFYGFGVDEILDADRPSLERDLDPKCAWALAHRDRFPVDVMKADYDELLRVPGIGVTGASRIVAARRQRRLSLEDLPRLGVSLSRARYFLAFGGGGSGLLERPARLRRLLSDRSDGQLELFG